MGEVLDGVSEHMKDYPEDRVFLVANEKPCNVEKVLKESGTDILLNYLLLAVTGPLNSTPRLAERRRQSHQLHAELHRLGPALARRFEEKGIPVVGDDVKSRWAPRSFTVPSPGSLRTGGEARPDLPDQHRWKHGFSQHAEPEPLKNKRISKTEAIQSQLDIPLEPETSTSAPRITSVAE